MLLSIFILNLLVTYSFSQPNVKQPNINIALSTSPSFQKPSRRQSNSPFQAQATIEVQVDGLDSSAIISMTLRQILATSVRPAFLHSLRTLALLLRNQSQCQVQELPFPRPLLPTLFLAIGATYQRSKHRQRSKLSPGTKHNQRSLY